MPELIKIQHEKGLLPHACLFSGTAESSKESAVNYLLQKILGISSADIVHPDLRILESDPITIENIRDIKLKSADGPLVAGKCFIYIKNIENLSREASPALLKLLEEPNAKTFILATTKKFSAILPTLRSRFSHIKFAEDRDAIKEEKFSVPKKPPEGADVAEFLRKALKYSESLVKKNPSPENIQRMNKLLAALDTLEDPTANKRLLGEYIMMLI